jgi:DNA-binding NarL/FixJ family response regulator
MMKPTSDRTIRVWLVEDNAMFAEEVQWMVDSLEDMECAGRFVSVEEAFGALDEGTPPEVILLDVQLPGMDGIAAIGTFRQRAPEAKVIILTAFDDAEKIFRAACAGASGYILKSSGIDRIDESIRQVKDGGASMSPGVAMKVLEAFARTGPSQGDSDEHNLTPREIEILRLLADGLVKKEIASSLGIGLSTVSTHLERVYLKLHVNTNTGAVAKALRKGII